jgi:hypothetical protein
LVISKDCAATPIVLPFIARPSFPWEGFHLRALVALATGLWFVTPLALAQPLRSDVVMIRSKGRDVKAIVIPRASALQLVSSTSPNGDIAASFKGRFTLAGLYKIEGYGTAMALTIWPDRKSSDSLPHWKDRDGPASMDISNAWVFAQAVVPKNKLEKLKSRRLKSVWGHVTIIADQYETEIDCDVVSASARFVSVVRKVEMAANPQEEEGC